LQFLDFSMVLYDFSKVQHKGSKSDFGFTNRSQDFTVRPLGGVHLLQLGPWARPAAGIAGIRPREGRDLPEKWSGMMRDSPRVSLSGWRRRVVLQRVSSAVPWMGSRGSIYSCELAERGDKPVAGKASVGIGVAGGELRW
jgi:hypothetical protein